jgi:hypothetical protein
VQLSWSIACPPAAFPSRFSTLDLPTFSTTLDHDFRTPVARSAAYHWERQLSWSIACLPYSVSIGILHIRSFFHPFSNQNPEHPQRYLNLASESCFGTCSQSCYNSHTGVLFTLSRCSGRNRSSEDTSHFFPLDFSPSPSTSPSPIHLL